ncbi:hypothetical protein [Acidipropionibacterium virtanenii]|uniref:Polysaccharide chain length determinant N-terminal domain-containing protein n=1 Tax=Acidipropionibacterium virtanenii TaxID=2057246 RepID=A0A344UTT9_9ACTN|nr:hypothetical protein [Acidipropionibacterium virtanenii]AXE38687.1 hypothetical protein JS278_01523 [Acidipropionibacterium virtanenii]
MTVIQTLRGLLRRWYILVAGLVIAAAAAAVVWSVVPATYTRTSTQILLPGAGMVPTGSNPYMYVGGLVPAADIVVRGLGSSNVIDEVVRGRPTTSVQVTRDPTTSGPVILITVESRSDADAAAALSAMNQRTATILDTLQAEESIPQRQRISVVTVSVDKRGIIGQRTRLLATGAAGAGVLALAVLIASFVEGIGPGSRGKNRMPESEGRAEEDGEETQGGEDQAEEARAEEDPRSASVDPVESAPAPPDPPVPPDPAAEESLPDSRSNRADRASIG